MHSNTIEEENCNVIKTYHEPLFPAPVQRTGQNEFASVPDEPKTRGDVDIATYLCRPSPVF